MMTQKKYGAYKTISLVMTVCLLLNMLPALSIGNWWQHARAADPDFETDDMQVMTIDPDGLQKTIDLIAMQADDIRNGKGKIILDTDYTENITVPDDAEVVLDLNGHTLSPVMNDSEKSNVIVYGKLKIKNTAEEGGALQSDGSGDVRALDVVNGGRAILDNITINSYHSANNGGGIIVEENGLLELKNTTVSNCSSDLQGGGIYVFQGDSVELENTTFDGNSAQNGGGIYYYRTCEQGLTAEYTYNGLTLTNNTAEEMGGGMYIEYPLTLNLNTVKADNNTAKTGGAMYFGDSVTLNIKENSSICGNTATETQGGGVYLFMKDQKNAPVKTKGSEVSLTDTKVNNNTAAMAGGGFYFKDTAPTTRNKMLVEGCELNNNTSGTSGGAIYMYSKTDLLLSNSTVSGNEAGTYGGGFYMYGTGSGDDRSTFTMNHSDVMDNHLESTSDRYGAGMYVGSNTVVALNAGHISGNRDALQGAGAYFGSGCEVNIHEGMVFSQNKTSHPGYGWQAGGGAFFNGCRVNMDGGTFSGNVSTEPLARGGGFWANGGTLILTGGQVLNNRVTENGGGIGFSSSNVEISGDFLISGNRANYGGGIFCEGGTNLDIGGDAVIEKSTGYRGGAMYANGSGQIIIRENASIRDNTSSDWGGGIAFYTNSIDFHMMGGEIVRNKAATGGGLMFYGRRNNAKRLQLTGGRICDNTATGSGGGVYVESSGGTEQTIKISDTVTHWPQFAGPTLEISTDIEISGNTAASSGGGICMARCTRLEMKNGAKVVNNTSGTNGGGVYVSNAGHYFHKLRDTATGGDTDKALEIMGGELHDNMASSGGRDLYIAESQPDTRYYKLPYSYAVKATNMENAAENAAWLDEGKNEYNNGVIDNRAKIDNNETPQYSAYTFEGYFEEVAQIGSTVYPSITAAIDAIVAGTAEGTEILLLKTHRESVRVPEGVTATLDLQGYSLYGVKNSVIYVEKNADFTVKDTVGTSTLEQGRGEGNYGGAVYVLGKFRMEGGTLTNNYGRWGSAIAGISGSKVELEDVTITGNKVSNNDGSTLYFNAATVNINHVNVVDNASRAFYFENSTKANITNTKVSGCSGANGYAVYSYNYSGSVIVFDHCEFSGNNATNSVGTIHTAHGGGRMWIKNSVIKNNQTAYGAAIYLQSYLHLENTIVTENISTGGAGGIYVANGGNGRLYMKNSQVYNNKASTQGNDVQLNAGTYFYNENDDDTDGRVVESFGLDDYNCWQDDNTNIYYVQNKDEHDPLAAEFLNISGDLVRVNDGYVQKTVYLTAVKAPVSGESVAEIVDTGVQYPTLTGAFLAASRRDDAVEIRLLKDVSEKITVQHTDAAITLDFNGHTVYGTEDVSQVFYINAADIHMKDSVGGGRIRPSQNENTKKSRGIQVNGGKLIIDDIEISGFDYGGSGAGIYTTGGTTVNSVWYPTELYIRSGKICNNTAAAGAGIYFTTSANSRSVFEMSGGSVENNTTTGNGTGIYLNCTTWNDYSKLTISGGLIKGNTSTKGNGAGIYYSGAGDARETDDFQVYGCTVQGNTAVRYSGIWGERAGNREHSFVLGREGVQTVIDGNHCTTEYAAGWIYNDYTDTLPMLVQNVEIKNNTSANTNASLYVRSHSLTLTKVDFHHNRNEYSNDSCLRAAGGTLLVEDCIFHDNWCKTTGAGLVVQDPGATIRAGTKVVRNCKFYNNRATGGAGMWDNNLDDTTYENLELYDNLTLGNPGGAVVIANSGVTRTKTFLNCHIHDNTSRAYGGGVSTSGAGGVTVVFGEGTIVENNTAASRGGGIYTENDGVKFVVENGAEIRNNRSNGQGGGLDIYYGSLEVRDGGKISGNYAAGHGGGIYYWSHVAGRGLYIKGGTIENNESRNYGGGVYALGRPGITAENNVELFFTGGEIKNNKGVYGGGVFIDSDTNTSAYKPSHARFTGTKIIGNYATADGGGIYNNQFCYDTEISGNTLITENIAGSLGGGLAISSRRTDVKLIDGANLFGNQAGSGQDVYVGYYSSYRSSNAYLQKAADMFGPDDIYQGIGWLDETKGTTETSFVQIRPIGRGYPYTLSYRAAHQIVAVYNGIEYETVQDAIQAVEASGAEGEITMVADSVENVTIGSGVKVKLNLNGHLLKGNGKSAITNRGQLEIDDRKQTVIVGEHTYEQVDTDGTITGTSATCGGGINVVSGRVIMQNGVIANCLAGANTDSLSYGGGAVCVSGGEFIMRGGTIRDNVALNGSAVLVRAPSGTFTMFGGTICDNKSSAKEDSKGIGRGAVTNNGGEVNIYGGTLNNNVARLGGAVYNQGGTSNLVGVSAENGPVLQDNIGGTSGGAVYVNGGTANISNATLKNNKTTAAKNVSVYSADALNQGAGGAVYNYTGTVIIDDGTLITGNYAVRGGAIFQYRGTVMIGGNTTVITDNSALFGGGCAQNPLCYDRNTVMELLEGASVYGNHSITTGAGNDFYSGWEGTNTYAQQLGNAAQNTPSITLVAAKEMAVGSQYNVWKNDNYVGNSRVGDDLISGQYVRAEVEKGNNIQITASYFDTEAHTVLDSDFVIKNMVVSEMKDGKPHFDNGVSVGTQKMVDSSSKELQAKELLSDPSSGATESEQTYRFNGEDLHYILYNGRLYERNQAVTWEPGNDSNDHNGIVRSFDTVTYTLAYSFEGDPKVEEYTRDYNVEIKVKAILNCDKKQAMLKSSDMRKVSVKPAVDEHGNTIQIMTGYIRKKLTPTDLAAGTMQIPITMEVYGLQNGYELKPSFELWFNGNTHSPHYYGESEKLTVSAAPKYNITVLNNDKLLHTGYFDIISKTEVGESDAEKEGVVYGTILGFGATVELYNDPTVKGLTGIELPGDELEFDLDFEGKLYNSRQEVVPNGTGKPIVWAYKENNDFTYGRDLDSTLDIINMSWDDEDWKSKHSHYAYGAAPWNTGANDSSCFDGGGWLITRAESDGPNETKLHVKVNNYNFDGSNYPTKYAGNVASNILGSTAVKAFTAGYIQLVLPLNPDEENGHLNFGYYQIYMDAVASKLKVESITGQKPEEVVSASNLDTPEKITQDLDGMNEFYHFADSNELRTRKLAINERRYMDNYINVSQALTIFPDGAGTTIGKWNIFNNQNNEHINGTGVNDTGRGDTPLNSTVYIEGGVDFNSDTYNTADANSSKYGPRDPRYNASAFNVLEYDYMTGFNILQKFDADAYRVYGTAKPVINVQNGNTLNNLLGQNIKISYSDEAMAWSDLNTKYKLTILYGAKPDGSNWVKKQKTDTSVNPNIIYDDGGALDMDRYREENLVFFETIEDLHLSMGSNAKCVAILYQVRDTVVRTGTPFAFCAKAEVTGEFERVGDTYCTTNDVRAWYTYRPYYKLDYSDGLHYKNSYGYLWTQMQINTDEQTTDPDRDDYKPRKYGAVLPPEVFMDYDYDAEDPDAPPGAPSPDLVVSEEDKQRARDIYYIYTQQGAHPIMLSSYTDYYIKTRYRNGVKVGGSHNGMNQGNSLLLYTVDTRVDLNVESKEAGTNRVKMEYNVTEGERDVSYRITPHISVASGANKTALTRNGTQSADISIDVHLPKLLHYQNGSITFNYKYSGYKENEMSWTSSVEETETETIITLSTYVSDIDKALPEIIFDAFIGDATDPAKDVQYNGTSLSVYSVIKAEYASIDLMAAEAHSDSKTILALLSASEGIVKTVDEKLVELGEEMSYNLTYSNTTEQGATYRIQMVDVLPHMGDGRSTSFTGGYRVGDVSVTFTNEGDFNEFVSHGTPLAFTQEGFKWSTELESNSNLLRDFMTNVIGSEMVTLPEGSIESNAETRTIVYHFGDADIRVLAYDDAGHEIKKAPAMFVGIPWISGNQRVSVNIKLIPTEKDTGSLIESGNDSAQIRTQNGGNVYRNSFAYRRIENEEREIYSTALVSNRVSVTTVVRDISGVVWMDQDQDGMYNTQEAVTYNNKQPGASPIELEYPVSGIDVRLMKVNDDNTLTEAVNVFGQPFAPVKTDENGKYSFNNVAAGKYTVVFSNEEDNYQIRFKQASEKKHPLPFSKLSVTTDANVQADRGNKAYGIYNDAQISEMQSGQLLNVITMPEKQKIPTTRYSSPNWNMGLYYQDLTVAKIWENMIYGISERSTIEFAIIGREEVSKEIVVDGLLRISNDTGTVKAEYFEDKNGQPVEKALTITQDVPKHIYNWSISQNDRIFLQAENKNGAIEYDIEEITIRANGNDISAYYNVFEDDVIKAINKKRTFTATNSQIVGSIVLVKHSTEGEPLEGAEFSLYQVPEGKDPADDRFYGSKHGVGDTLTESYQKKTTVQYYKTLLGGDRNLLQLEALNMYNPVTKNLTVKVNNKTYVYKVHSELNEGAVRYYYYTTENVSYTYELIIGNMDSYEALKADGTIDINDKYHQDGLAFAVLRRRVNDEREYYVKLTVTPSQFTKVAMIEFRDLPLYDTQGHAIYYTVRETKEPDGYVSLADFNMLTGMNLFNGVQNSEHEFVHDLGFEVENTKQMELPITGGSSFTMVTMLGALLMGLGGTCLFWLMLVKKKKKEGSSL